MTPIRTYTSASAFCAEVTPHLLRDELFHSQTIGLTQRLADEGWSPEAEGAGSGSLLASAWLPDGSFDFAAWCSPPRALTITGGSESGLRALAALVRARSGHVVGCAGPRSSVERFTSIIGRPFTIDFDSAVHRLSEVQAPKRLAEVEVVVPTGREAELIGRWNHRFMVDCGLAAEGSDPPPDPTEEALARYFLAKDPSGEPVAMAAVARETPNSANVASVYTPEAQRGKGYASALVAEVSQRILDSGKTYCTLFTDLANPTSNRIYAALGFERIGDYRWVKFDSE